MQILLSKIKPNPYRNIDKYVIDNEKIDDLKASIEETSFWNNIVV